MKEIENNISYSVNVGEHSSQRDDVFKKTKNYCLALFEILACFLIVFIHCSFPGDIGLIIKSAARFGVPLFYAIAGYYLFDSVSTITELRIKIKQRIKRIGGLLLFSFLVYLVIGVSSAYIDSSFEGVLNYFKNTFSFKKIALLLICNDPLTHFINWFMIAQIFSYVIIYLFPKLFFKNNFFVYVIASFALFWIIFRIIALSFKIQLFGIELDSDYLYRSWYANGLIFMSLGIVIKRNIQKIIKISNISILIILSFSFLLMIFEEYFLIKVFGSGISYNFGAIGTVLAIFCLSIKNPSLFHKIKLFSIKGNWISFVYILHPAIITLVSLLFAQINFVGIFAEWVKPLIVLLFSIFVALFVNFVFVQIKKNISKKH